MADDLRACPFCGGEAKRIDIEEGENAGGSCIACSRCMASSNVEFGRKENFVSRWNTRREDEVVRLREALAKIADGDVPRPIGKHWRADCKPSKHDQCTHGVWMYADCGACIGQFARAALRSGGE